MMLLKISHTTSYHYDAPVPYALQQLRLTPKSRNVQNVLDWSIEIEGGKTEARFEDEHANTVDLISLTPGVQDVIVTCSGTVEVTDTAGVIGQQTGFVPLWLFRRQTARTEPGPKMRALLNGFERPEDDLDCLHALSDRILDAVPYSTNQEEVALSAEQTVAAGHGVCQDHAHIFVGLARSLGYPARYVSGYLMLTDREDQDASHAWAEAHIPSLGWVGFDISNGISPDARYVRVATALDYDGSAPVRGLRFGHGVEEMRIQLTVSQQ